LKNYHFKRKIIVKNKDYISLLPYPQWINQMNRDLADLTLKIDISDQDTEKIASIGNNLSLILFYAGDSENARDLCEKMMTMFFNKYQGTKDNIYLEILLQPYINKVRLSRISGEEIERKLIKIKFDLLNDNFIDLNGLKIPVLNINQTANFNIFVLSLGIELIKSQISLNKINEFNEESWQLLLEKCDSFIPIYQDMQILKLIENEEYDQALELTLELLSFDLKNKSYFYFRLIQILMLAELKEEAKILINKKYDSYISRSSIPKDELELAFELLDLLNCFDLENEISNLLDLLKNQYEKNNDEFGLLKVFQWITDNFNTNIFKNEESTRIITTMKNSGYIIFSKNLNQDLINELLISKTTYLNFLNNFTKLNQSA
jgi:hypothetical protein